MDTGRWSQVHLPGRIETGLGAGGVRAMRYLAVPEMSRHSFWASLRHRGYFSRQWHAVTDSSPKPIKTLCGQSYTAEAHRTWDQTTSSDRCSACEHLVMTTSKTRGATFIAEGVSSPRGA